MFQSWIQDTYNQMDMVEGMSLDDFRMDICVQLMNLHGEVVKTYAFYRCLPSGFLPWADLDEDSNVVVIQSLKLESQGSEIAPVVP